MVQIDSPRQIATPRARLFYGGVTVEALVGLLASFLHIGRKSLWYDEAVSAVVSGSSFHEMARVVTRIDSNMSLYLVVLRVWQQPFGDGEAALRSLSALAISATVVAIALLGRRLSDWRTGLAAGLVFAVAPTAQRFGQQARSYGLTLLLLTCAGLMFVRLIRDRRAQHVVGYAGLAAVSCYFHVLALLVILAHFSSLFFLPPREIPWKRLLQSGSLLAFLIAPLVVVSSTVRGAPVWIDSPRLVDLFRVPSDVAGGDLLTVIVGLTVAYGFWCVILNWKAGGRSMELWQEGFAASWALIPFVVALAVSVLVQPIFIGRYLGLSLPGLALLAGWALTRLEHRWVAVACLTAITTISCYKLVLEASGPPEDDFRAAVALVHDLGSSRDGLIACPANQRPGTEYYVMKLGDQVPTPVSPPQPWGAGLSDQAASRRRLVRLAGTLPSIWVITSEEGVSALDCGRGALDDRDRTLIREFAGMKVERYESLLP